MDFYSLFLSINSDNPANFVGKTKGCGHCTGVSWNFCYSKLSLPKTISLKLIPVLRCLWRTHPSWLGFFVDVNLFKANNKKAAELSKDSNTLLKNIDGALDPSSSTKDSLADEDSNLMVKLKFLTYKVLFHCLQLLAGLCSLVTWDMNAMLYYIGLVTFMLMNLVHL
jgi:hypothetical protein